ncbi:MAG TPA: class I adenylate-forming enzyme family protein [Acidimicrobiia bacterium]|nr:class I adenylate-forming enzyme family protein [Acidimicrobiia bacterium]
MSTPTSAFSTVGGVLRAHVAERPDAEYVVCDDDRLSYAEAERRSRLLARGLLAIGAGRGSRIGLLFPTGVEFVLAWLAAVRIGAIAVPISTFSTSRELRDLLARADVDLVLGVREYRGNDYSAAIADAVGSFEVVERGVIGVDERPIAAPHLRGVLLDRFASLEARAADVPDAVLDAIEDDVTPDDRMVIVHTSGSTSAPKGVIHQHGPLLGHLHTLNQIRGLHAGTRLFSNSPMFWIGGLAYNVAGVLVAGATLLCTAATDPVEALDFIERERPELTNGYAASIAALVAHPSFARRDFSSIRSGNLHPLLPAAIRPTDVELRHNMLGTTETGSVCLMSSDETDQPEHRRGSFGLPVPGLTPRVVDTETLADVPVGTIGELWFRGPSLMEGYYGRERFEIFTADGWYRTGDLFHVDGDGYFYFHGRRGSMIKTAGANVSPLEVEAALSDATGGLAVMVLGVPDPERDQVVAAVILAEPDTAPDLDALRAELRTRLSAYKVPRRFLVLAPTDLPMLSSGKPDLAAIEELFT